MWLALEQVGLLRRHMNIDPAGHDNPPAVVDTVTGKADAAHRHHHG